MASSLLGPVVRRCSPVYLRVSERAYRPSQTPPSFYSKTLFSLNQYFYDIEYLVNWSSWWMNRKVRNKNAFFGYTRLRYGVNVAAAYYILKLGGSFRFTDRPEVFRPDSRGKFSFGFLDTPDSTIEEIDLSGTPINHFGLENIVSQTSLRSLRLQGCPEVDDWFLARLHVFGETLEELDLSHCSCITVGGLAALQNLRKLRRLDVSSLPRVNNPGLVRILLEEMLPHCGVTGAEYEQGLMPKGSLDPDEEPTETSSLDTRNL